LELRRQDAEANGGAGPQGEPRMRRVIRDWKKRRALRPVALEAGVKDRNGMIGVRLARVRFLQRAATAVPLLRREATGMRS
jgi:hypothetical protein